ncbi:MAG: hypothetical protein QGI13_05765 [Rhodospirillales bacterium]|jgi:hypothetical protein|nr:hypothetical protein [Rhodospirillales bacterium]
MSGLESAAPREPAAQTPTAAAPAGAAGADKPFSLFGDDGFTFADFIDIINPLQHIPVLSTLYRHLTGDTIDAAPRVMGGTLFGGPIGAVASLINVFIEESTGKDLGEHAVALFTDEAAGGGTAVAESEVAEARFETASGGADEPVAATTDAIVATVRANRFAGATIAAPMGSQPPPPPPLALSPRKDQATSPSPRQIALATTQLHQGKRQGDAFAMLRYRAALRDPDDDKDRKPETPAPGASAAQGGWFTDAMLSGLVKYDAAARQSGSVPGSAVDLSN